MLSKAYIAFMTEYLQNFHYGLCWAHQSTSENTVSLTFTQETEATGMYQTRELYFCICKVRSLPLSPGLPGWPGLPGNPCMPGDPCSPCGPGAPGRPGSPGGPAIVRVETDWLGIWFRIELYLAIWPGRKRNVIIFKFQWRIQFGWVWTEHWQVLKAVVRHALIIRSCVLVGGKIVV